MRRAFLPFLVVLACTSVLAPRLRAQQLGRISGTVTDAVHGVLPGAQVVLEPTHQTTSADGQGRFLFLAVPPGAYTVTVSYVGFEAATKNVNVIAGQTSNLDVVLQVAKSSMDVTVKAARAYGEAEAINTERSSDNIVYVLPETVVTSLPNANVADAIGRLPGITLERDEGEGKYVQIRGTEPRLSNVTIDGVEVPAPESGVRQVKLDVIPADLVGSMELNETLQANQEGDAIGGSVNLVTKTAGDTPTLTFYTLGGITPIDNTRYTSEVGGTVGKRFGVRKQWGAIISGSFDYNGRGIDDVEPVPGFFPNTTTFTVQNADIRQYLYDRTRYGFAGSLDNKLNANSTLYLRGLMSDFKDGGYRTVYNIDTTGATSGGASTERRIGDYLISSMILGGNHILPDSNAWINWQVSAAHSRMLYPQFDNFASFSYVGPSNQCQFNSAATTDYYYPQFTQACFSNAYNPNNFDFNFLKMGDHGIGSKLDLAAKADAAKNFILGSGMDTVQVGAEIRNLHQFDDSFAFYYNPATNPQTGNPYVIPLAPFLDKSYHNSNYYSGVYPAGPFIDFNTTKNYVLGNPAQFTLTSTQGQDSNNFDLIERIPAAYVMDVLDIGHYRLTGGVRMEQTSVNTLSPDTNNSLTVKGHTSYVSFLPSAALQYKLDKNSDLRLVAGRGISRPIPYDLTSAVSLDTSTNPFTYSIGNPALRPEFGNDFDVLYERYLTPLGLIRGGYFYKFLTSPIVQLLTRPTTGPYAGFQVNQPANAGSAHVQGLEVAFEQQFTYLPGRLRGLGLSANYSYTESKALNVAPAVRSDSPALLRQAPNTWNISPTFDLGRIAARVGLAYNGPNIFQYNFADGNTGGITGPFGDVYQYSHFQVDAQASVRFHRGLSLILSGLNLNNAPFGFYQGSPQFMIQREFYKPTYSIGIRWNRAGE